MDIKIPLFKCQDPDGVVRVLNLDKIASCSIDPTETPPAHWFFMTDGEGVRVCPEQGERLMAAWQEFLHAKHLVTALGLGEVIPFGD